MEVRTNHPVLHIYAGYYLPELHPAQRTPKDSVKPKKTDLYEL